MSHGPVGGEGVVNRNDEEDRVDGDPSRRLVNRFDTKRSTRKTRGHRGCRLVSSSEIVELSNRE